MSNRLTFSLASLILILGLVFATAPAMAQTQLTAQNAQVTVVTTNDNTDIAGHNFGVIREAVVTGDLPAGATAIATDVNAGPARLPNLEKEFASGVTIVLAAPINQLRTGATTAAVTGGVAKAGTTARVAPKPAATGGTDIKAKDLVISEIMWGLHTGATNFTDQTDSQFIELYNTVGAADAATVDVVNWKIFYFRSHPDYLSAINTNGHLDIDLNPDSNNEGTHSVLGDETFIVVDIVSNISGGGYTFDIGQSGKIGTAAVAGTDLISAYRNIGYAKVESTTSDLTDAKKIREEQLKGVPNGEAKDSWKASTRLYGTNLKGSPGAEHFKGLSVVTASTVPYAPFVINEFKTDPMNNKHNWLEIRNKDAGEKSLKNYFLSHVDVDAKEYELVNFKDKDIKIPGGGVLLIVATEPKGDKNHPIAAGINVETEEGANADDLEKNGLTSRYIVRDGIKNLSTAKILLILRSAHDKIGKAEAFVDVTGSLSIENTSADYVTKLWPLKKTGAPHDHVIKTADGKDGGQSYGAGVYKRIADGAGWGKHTWQAAGTDGPGYKRQHQGKGTPGYDNGAIKVFNKKDDADDYDADIHDASKYVSISEIMYHSERNSPQWIELYNSSMTQAVQLDDWRLMLENTADADNNPPIRKRVTVKLASKVIQPNQTVLIVAFNSNRNSRQFPSDRLIDIWKGGLKDKDKLEITEETSRTNFTFLSEKGFKITLKDAAGNEIDTVGNATAEPAWELPAMSDEGVRASIIRRYNTGDATGTSAGRGSGEGMAQDGTMAPPVGWTVAMGQETYYGNQNDFGSPGYRAGGPLPVSLSKFRPERLESGDIVIRWITESELNNAGFNILRSETRDGAFTQINTSLIAGKGTTSERSTYEWKDTTAKPNVVYYYQIQDVSLDGQVQTPTDEPSERRYYTCW